MGMLSSANQKMIFAIMGESPPSKCTAHCTYTAATNAMKMMRELLMILEWVLKKGFVPAVRSQKIVLAEEWPDLALAKLVEVDRKTSFSTSASLPALAKQVIRQVSVHSF
jgi:hypothetical protein